MTETDAASLPRETGQEKSTAVCPNCGTEVGIIESPYGSTSPAACPKCYAAASPDADVRQQASAPVLPRELGTRPGGAADAAAGGADGAVVVDGA